MTWEVVKLNQILFQVKDKFDVKNDMDYSQITVSNTGVVSLRGVQKGFNIGTKKQTIAHKGQFIYSRLGVHQGSFGIVPKELDGAIVTGDMPIFEIDREKIYPNFLIYCLKLPSFKKKLTDLTRGLAQSRVREKFFLDIDIKIPSLDEQKVLLNKLDSLNISMNVLLKNNLKNESYISWLRQAILSDAVTGRLVPQDPNDEPAEKLLDKIKAEKEKLIKEKILKKEKQMPKVSENEFPFEIPKTWAWVRLNEIAFITKLAGFEYSKYIHLSDSGEIPVVRAQNVKNNFIKKDNLKYIDAKTSQGLERSALVKKSILMTFIGAGIGDIALFNEPTRWHLAPNVAKIELHLPKLTEYLIWYFNSAQGRKQIFKHLKTTAQPSLSMQTIRDIFVPIPPEQEQFRILQRVTSLMKICDEQEKNILETKENINKLNQTILREMFN